MTIRQIDKQTEVWDRNRKNKIQHKKNIFLKLEDNTVGKYMLQKLKEETRNKIFFFIFSKFFCAELFCWVLGQNKKLTPLDE